MGFKILKERAEVVFFLLSRSAVRLRGVGGPASDPFRNAILQDQPELALVQARWTFVNRDENLLTRLQNVNLCFHFEVEQQVNGVFLNFFGFNGTAGVWRIKALEESGGWLERTTVEDMDVAVRAHLQGWKFIFLNDVEVSPRSLLNLGSAEDLRERSADFSQL